MAAQTITPQPSPSPSPSRPTMHAARTSTPIKLDGVLDEPAWQNAPVTSDFTQSFPNSGGKPTDSTQVRVLYDNDALYVGIRAYDSDPKQIAAQLARRDAINIYSDWLHVAIGTYHDRRTAFRFAVNPLGVKKDVLEYNDNQEDLNWDAVWDVATKVDSLGWTAEFRIPFSQLRFPSAEPRGGRVWDIEIMRDIARRSERDSWAPWTLDSPGFVSSFGELDHLDGIPGPSRLEILPYVSAKDMRAPSASGDPFFHSNATKLTVGGDLKYGLPNGLTLTATVNPDFGQVEVDPAVVNLSAFETFFPEKRPFFLEGADIFNFGATRTFNDYGSQYYFYSRRIGRQPQRKLAATYVDAPDRTTIIGATKLTGQAGVWAVGALDAMTSEQNGRYFNSPTDRGIAPIEPRTNYFVGRLRRDLNDGNSFVGGIVTATNRALDDSALGTQLRSASYLGGLDFEHSWVNREWIMTGLVAGTRVDGSPSAIASTQRASSRYYQRPDADYVHYDSTRTSLGGYTGELALEKNGPWNGSIALKTVSPGFEINDVGFQSNTDYRVLSTAFGYQDQTPGSHFRSFDVYGFTNHGWTFGNVPMYAGVAGGWDVQLNNLLQLGGQMRLNPATYDERLTRGGPLARIPTALEPRLYITTDSRWPVTATLNFDEIRNTSGANTSITGLTLDARPTSYVHLNLGPTLTQQYSTDQYVQTVTDPSATAMFGHRYVFSNLHQTTLSLDTRVDWTFTPTLTLQVYAQPFLSAGRYTAIKELARSRSYDFNVYGQHAGTIAYDPAARAYTIDPDGPGPAASFTVLNPDFNVRSLHGDAVLRWEYRPGSTMFFVWEQERSGADPNASDFEFRRDVGAVFREQPTNTFLVKFAYWIGR